MKMKYGKRIFALAAVAALGFTLMGCSDMKQLLGGEAGSASTAAIPKTVASAGGTISLPPEFVVAQEANTLTNELIGDQFMGSFNLVSYKTSRAFYITGDTITLTGDFSLYSKDGEPAVTEQTDATISLWEKSDTQAVYVETVHFVADGTTQTYTFQNLKSGGKYRIGITYTDKAMYRMSGSFVISPVSGTSVEDEGDISDATAQA